MYIYIYGYIYLYKYMDMVATSPTPRSAVTRHQRVRNAVWSDSRQTTRRAIPRHETTRIVVHIDAHTCVCNCFLKSLYWWQYNLWNTHPKPNVLYERFALRNLVVLCHGTIAHMYKKTSTVTECVKRRMCTGDSSLSSNPVTFAYTRCVFCIH